MGRKPKGHQTRAQSFGRSQLGKAELCAAAASVSLRSKMGTVILSYACDTVCLRVLPAKFSGSVRYTVRALAGGVVHEIFHRAQLRSTGGQAAHVAPTHEIAPRWLSPVSGLEPGTTYLMRRRRSQLRSTTPRSVSCQARGTSRRAWCLGFGTKHDFPDYRAGALVVAAASNCANRLNCTARASDVASP